MANLFLYGGSLSSPINMESGTIFPRWPDGAVLITPIAASGSMTAQMLFAAVTGVVSGATHLSLHGQDPGTTGVGEHTNFRVAAQFSLVLTTGSVTVVGPIDGATSTSSAQTASYWGVWSIS